MLFQPSPFWRVFRKALSLRFALGVAIVLVCLEAVARLAPDLVGLQVHQRYLYVSRESKVDDTTLGQQLRWVANGRGARGDLYRGQPIEIAVFGSSTSEDWGLDQDQSWAQQVKLDLGRDIVHVDNFARNDAYHKEAIVILDELARTGRHYDAVLLMVSIDRSARAESLANGFFYWGQWGRGSGGRLRSRSLLLRRLGVQVKAEERLRRLGEWLAAQFSPPAPPRRHPPRNARSNRRLRQTGQVRLAYVPPNFDDEAGRVVDRETRRLLEAARRAADHVFLITQPVAYDENEKPGVSRRWFSLYPIEGQDAYQDDRSVAERIRVNTAAMVATAESLGVPVIDLDAYMRPMLAQRDDLFFDKWHFSAAGAQIAGAYIADRLRQAGILEAAGHERTAAR